MTESPPSPPRTQRAAPSIRGVTTALRYSLLLVIVTLLLAGLYVGVGGFVENQQERAIGSQLETVGNRLAAELGTASRLVETGTTSETTSPTVVLEIQLPDSVGASEYRIDITDQSGSRYQLTLRSVEPAVRTSVVVRSDVDIRTGTVEGGRLRIQYKSGQLEVTNA